MALESATYISGLGDTNPAGSDAISQGDDHIRLIKTVLKNTLPNADEAMNGIHASASEPSPNSTGQLWFDTTNNLIKIRNEADDGWIILLATEGSRLLRSTHAIQSASSYMRTETYADSGFSITHNKLSTSSTLYVQLNMYAQMAFNFEHESNCESYVRLANTSGTLIVGTTDDLRIFFTEDVGQGTGVTWDNGHGWGRIWKVTSANCPDGTSGNNTFDIWQKMNDSDDGGITFMNGTMMVWEIEE